MTGPPLVLYCVLSIRMRHEQDGARIITGPSERPSEIVDGGLSMDDVEDQRRLHGPQRQKTPGDIVPSAVEVHRGQARSLLLVRRVLTTSER